MAQQLRSCLRSCTNSTCEREGTTEKVAVHVCLSCCLLHDSLIVLVRGLDEVGGGLQGGVWPTKGALIGVRPAAIHELQNQNGDQDLAACLLPLPGCTHMATAAQHRLQRLCHLHCRGLQNVVRRLKMRQSCDKVKDPGKQALPAA